MTGVNSATSGASRQDEANMDGSMDKASPLVLHHSRNAHATKIKLPILQLLHGSMLHVKMI